MLLSLMVKFVLYLPCEKNENKNEAGFGPFLKKAELVFVWTKDAKEERPVGAVGLADRLQTNVAAAKTPAAICSVSPGL